ncbi:MAG TPA: DNA translocase FtsK 4TM domain-containing protein, partial [Candidatus Sulfotelmatobacter sp.]|nr:DNA translocase FtsK 4TM domain-containing protein [Candidatus Sulfotelmatobacter sp.]
MVDRSGTAPRFSFLPDGMRDFLRRRSVEAGGVGLFLLAVAIGVSLATYSPHDRSFNHATAAPVSNAMGVFGAYVADILLQTLGLGGAVLALTLVAWAWCVVVHRGVRWPQVALLPPALILAAGALALLPDPAVSRLPVGPGGEIGKLLLERGVLPLLARSDLGASPALLTAVLGVLALAAVAFAMGLTLGEWQSLGRGMGQGVGHGAGLLVRGATRLGRRGDEATREPSLRDEPRRMRRPPEPDQDDEDDDAAERLPIRGLRGEMRPDRLSPEAAVRVRDEPRIEKRGGDRRARRPAEQPALDLVAADEYQLPPLKLLTTPPSKRAEAVSEEALEQNARLLESTLEDFG